MKGLVQRARAGKKLQGEKQDETDQRRQPAGWPVVQSNLVGGLIHFTEAINGTACNRGQDLFAAWAVAVCIW